MVRVKPVGGSRLLLGHLASCLVMSLSAKPRLAERQPSYRGGVPRVKTRPSEDGKRGRLRDREVWRVHEDVAVAKAQPVP